MLEHIERYENILKVFLTQTIDYPEGYNFFYCDADMEDLLRSASSLSFYGKRESRYVSCQGVPFHRLAVKASIPNNYVVDHISGLTYDDCSSNLRVVTTYENNLNKPVSNITYNAEKELPFSFKANIVPLGIYASYRFATEVDALIARSAFEHMLRTTYHLVTYEFLRDRRNDEDLVDLLRTGQISDKEELDMYISRYSDNAWYYFRFKDELEAYRGRFSLSKYDIKINDKGFLVDTTFEDFLSPYFSKKANLSKELDYLVYERKVIEAERDRLEHLKHDISDEKSKLERVKDSLIKSERQLLLDNNLITISDVERLLGRRISNSELNSIYFNTQQSININH